MSWFRKFFGSEEEEEEEESLPPMLPSKETSEEKKGPSIVLYEPLSFEDSRSIADSLKARKPVVVNLERLDHELARRCIDFLSGTIYALNGSVEKIAESVFLFAPSSIAIEEFRRKSWEEMGTSEKSDLFFDM